MAYLGCPPGDKDPVSRSRAPEVGAKVEIVGETGTYLVVRVDQQRYVADLMLMGRDARIELGVHFACIRVLPDPRTTSYGLIWKRLVVEGAEKVS